MSLALDILAGLAALGGGVFTLLAAIGVLRFGDVFMRMHASTKAGTLGLGLVVVAVLLRGEGHGMGAKAVAVLLFMIFTSPVGAHLIGRAVWRRMSARERAAGRPDEGESAR